MKKMTYPTGLRSSRSTLIQLVVTPFKVGQLHHNGALEQHVMYHWLQGTIFTI
jgi:hypothetical protein